MSFHNVINSRLFNATLPHITTLEDLASYTRGRIEIILFVLKLSVYTPEEITSEISK